MIKRSITYLAVVLCILAIASCERKFGTTNSKWIHASPDAPALNVTNAGKEVLSSFRYNDVSQYINTDRSNLGFQVKVGEEIVTRVSNPIWDENAYYSVYVADSFGSINTVLLRDAHDAPEGGKALVRFLHLVPDLMEFRLFANGGEWHAERKFFFANQSQAEFINVDAGSYSFVAQTDTNSVLNNYPLAGSVQLEAGKAYTLYAKGFHYGVGDSTLSIGLVNE